MPDLRRAAPGLLLATGLLSGLGLPAAVGAQSGMAQSPAAQSPAAQSSAAQSLPAAGQSTSQRLRQLQQQLESQRQLSAQQKAELEDLRRRIAGLGQQQQATLSRLGELAGSIARLETQRRATDLQIAQALERLRALDLEITATEARVARLQTDVRGLLAALYRERSGRYLALLSQASSLSDLLIRARLANISGQANLEVIAQLRAASDRLTVQRQQQATQTAQLQALQQTQLAQLATLTASRDEQRRLLGGLRQTEQGQRALAAQTAADQALTGQSIGSLVDGIVRERARLEAERLRRIEEERRRREAELARIRAEQEAARREQARLAQLRAQEAAARARAQAQAAARARAVADAQARAAAEQQAQQQARARAAAAQAQAQMQQDQLAREQQSLRARQQQLQDEQAQAQAAEQPLPTARPSIGFPLPGGRVASPYGATGPWTVFSGAPGSQAVAVAGGNVLSVTSAANLGWVVIIDHGALQSVYFGLSAPSVQSGDRVGAGSPVGAIGGSPQFGPDEMLFQLRSYQNGQTSEVRPPF